MKPVSSDYIHPFSYPQKTVRSFSDNERTFLLYKPKDFALVRVENEPEEISRYNHTELRNLENSNAAKSEKSGSQHMASLVFARKA